jgi:hypothetical protein
MSFGLSFGPEGLRQSAGKLWEDSRCFSSLENGIGSLYADDLGAKVFHNPGELNPADNPSRGIWTSPGGILSKQESAIEFYT